MQHSFSELLADANLEEFCCTPATTHSLATCDNPSKEEFAGPYGFQMRVKKTDNARHRNWNYSPELKKVFMKVGCMLPLEFRVAENSPIGLIVRAVAVFCNDDAATMPVLRCPNHQQSLQEPINQEYPFLDHVVSCSHRSAVYEINASSERRSVFAVLSGHQAGCEWETISFALMCLGSCSGIKGRPLALVFTLEMGDQVVGRQLLNVRVCAAPKRDCNKEENWLQQKMQTEVLPEDCELTDRMYEIPVFDPQSYKTLASEAQQLVHRDFPEGPYKQCDIQMYSNIIQGNGDPSEHCQ